MSHSVSQSVSPSISKWFSRWVSLSCLRQWLNDKFVETLYSNMATTENRRIHTPLPPLHSKLGCLLFSISSSKSGTTLHGGDGGGKALFPLLEVSKASESPFRAKCLMQLILSQIAACKSCSESATLSTDLLITVSERSLVILFVPQTHALKN